MKKTLFTLLFAASSITSMWAGNTITISKAELMDKIKGGWAGQLIGVCYGAPTEFNYRRCMIPDNQDLTMKDEYIHKYFDNDDLYMELSFVEVFRRLGLDCPVDSVAMAYAKAGYSLWHANQEGRINILKGLMPPLSGHWKNNPHADDIDYQIEADYAGLMCPGMPNAASTISDKVGHIMNYGDGWYGGVYVGAMYSLAFIYDDLNTIIEKALQVIPKESRYYRCMSDIINWYKRNPADWQHTWRLCEEKYSYNAGCPEGVFAPLNIDAVINSAYILIGLLYGEGDLDKTMEIATRCGQDSDCNPSSAAGILGCLRGYKSLPEKYLKLVRKEENRTFSYTHSTLNDAYDHSFNLAMEVIKKNGGKVLEDQVIIKPQQAKAVRLEQSFEGIRPVETRPGKDIQDYGIESFEGCGIVVPCHIEGPEDYEAQVEIWLDGKLHHAVKAPVNYHNRLLELCYFYDLPEGKHTLSLRHLNPKKGVKLTCKRTIIYTSK